MSAITTWNVDDSKFWESSGKRIANRNLWISIPALLLAFAVWMVWSVVVAKLPAVGFKFTTDQLFWLAAMPGLSGATLRIFYSFMPPIFGGRLWTTLSTASLLIPAIGIGFAVQNPGTPYLFFLVLALLCGFGGGNFASSMANISFFFPRAEKGNALALNAGLGNLGVSVVQFVIPLVITAGVFGALGGDPQTATAGGKTTQLWLQNAGFIWVPFIVIATVAAWFGMNDIAAMKASFSDQAVIFKRKHNWVMCWLYTGTFGSFIGYSAGFPLLAKTQFPQIDLLSFVFLGPLVGALSRSATGWLSDKYGGGRVTFWVFALMIAAVGGVLYFLGIKSSTGRVLGFLRNVHDSVLRNRRGQCLDLPDDPGDYAHGTSAARAEHDSARTTEAGRYGIRPPSSASPRQSRPMAPSSSRRLTAPRSRSPADRRRRCGGSWGST